VICYFEWRGRRGRVLRIGAPREVRSENALKIEVFVKRVFFCLFILALPSGTPENFTSSRVVHAIPLVPATSSGRMKSLGEIRFCRAPNAGAEKNQFWRFHCFSEK
jgi:hypothetical protein